MPSVISVHDIDLNGLMFFEVVSNEEALLEIWIEIIHYLFSASKLCPPWLGRVILHIDDCNWI